MTATVKTIKEQLPSWMEKKIIKLQLEIRAKKYTYTELVSKYNRYNENCILSIILNNGYTIQNLIIKEAYAREAERVREI